MFLLCQCIWLHFCICCSRNRQCLFGNVRLQSRVGLKNQWCFFYNPKQLTLTFKPSFLDNLASAIVKTRISIASINGILAQLSVESASTGTFKFLSRLPHTFSLIFARIHCARVALCFDFQRQRLVTFKLVVIARN